MGSPIRIRARLKGDVTEVVMLLSHPMETGLRKDASGAPIAAHFITDVRVLAEGRTVLEARMSQAVSQDPLVSFRFRGGARGSRIRVIWTDNRGERRQDDLVIA
jgi:sulfur-oxidizing protein SoxZ